MSIRFILPTLIIGTSSAALAYPSANESNRGAVVRDHRGESRYGREQREWRERWLREQREEREERARRIRELREREARERRERWEREHARWRPIITTGYVDPGSTYVAPSEASIIGATALTSRLDLDTTGRLVGRTAIHLEARGGGTTYVDQVVLYYSSRAYQVIKVGKNLDANDAVFQIPLGDGSDVVRVIVDGRSSYGGAIAIDAT
jgi:hypothetical protein